MWSHKRVLKIKNKYNLDIRWSVALLCQQNLLQRFFKRLGQSSTPPNYQSSDYSSISYGFTVVFITTVSLLFWKWNFCKINN